MNNSYGYVITQEALEMKLQWDKKPAQVILKIW